MGRGRMRSGVAIILALALSACAGGPVGLAPPPETAAAAPTSTGEWKLERNIDRATGQSVGKASVKTDRVAVRGSMVIAKPAFVQLQCFRGKPIVLMGFKQKVGANRNASLTYRFDDKPPREANVHFHNDQMSIEIEDSAAVQQFVADLRDARTLFVSIDSLVIGATRAEFPVASAEPAIAHGFANCAPLPGALGTAATPAR